MAATTWVVAAVSGLRFSVDSQQLTVKLAARFDRLMDSSRLIHEIDIESASDDPGVFGIQTMERDEVFAIEGQQGAALRLCKCQDLIVWNRAVGIPRFPRRQDIVAAPSKLLDTRERKVLVGIEPRHQASSFSAIWQLISAWCERT
jgi:hypothetical protein